jgi:integrase
MSTQFSNKNQNALESMPEGVTWLQEGLEMPSNRTKWLLDQLKVEFERGAYRKNIKVDTLVRKLKKVGLSERDEQILRLHIKPVFGKLTLKESIEHSKEYAEKVGCEKVKSSAKKELLLFQRLIQLGDPSFKLPKIKFSKPGNKFQAWQILEIQQILLVIEKEVNELYRLPCKVALYTGMRRGNVLGLRAKDIDLKRREVRFTLNKSTKEMLVPISNKLAAVLDQVPWPISEDGLLFPDISSDALTHSVSRAFTRSGYPWFSFHKLRHTAACYLLERGVDITTISVLLGHSSIKVTMEFYARVKPEALKKAVGEFDV